MTIEQRREANRRAELDGVARDLESAKRAAGGRRGVGSCWPAPLDDAFYGGRSENTPPLGEEEKDKHPMTVAGSTTPGAVGSENRCRRAKSARRGGGPAGDTDARAGDGRRASAEAFRAAAARCSSSAASGGGVARSFAARRADLIEELPAGSDDLRRETRDAAPVSSLAPRRRRRRVLAMSVATIASRRRVRARTRRFAARRRRRSTRRRRASRRRTGGGGRAWKPRSSAPSAGTRRATSTIPDPPRPSRTSTRTTTRTE